MSKQSLMNGTSVVAGARLGASIEAAVLVYAMPHHADADGWLVQHYDGRVFLTLASTCQTFARSDDADAMPAFNRAFKSNPDLFRLLDKPELPVATLDSAPGLVQDLTPADRARLRAMTRKHWRFYFASQPTNAQVDQLIDAIGVEVATKLVKREVDGGRIH